MELRDYQREIAVKACNLLQNYLIAYLAMEVRTGKTLTALECARVYKAKKVLFLTKKKAIGSIRADFEELQPGYQLIVTNYEQLTNFSYEGFDLVILDEAHCLGQYPRMAERTKLLKNICRGLPIIYLSGTPTPESYSQIFHQLHVSSFSPFNEYSNFYQWVEAGYVEKKTKYVFNRQLNDYSRGNQEKIENEIKHLLITYTQADAGFLQSVKEFVLNVDMKDSTYALAKRLQRDRLYIGKSGEEILADTEVKMMQKLHQIYSGTVKTESGTALVFDDYKAHFIKHKFDGKKIAIFYKFIAEYEILKKTFSGRITESPEEFNNSTHLVFCSQIQSGREGINLSTADALIMYNIDFSSLSYQQAKARMQSRDRVQDCELYWIFSTGGIEEKIYERVINKQDYTLSYFRKDFKIDLRTKDLKTKTATNAITKSNPPNGAARALARAS